LSCGNQTSHFANIVKNLNPRLVLTAFFALATVSISLLGLKSSAIVLNLLVAIAGATTIETPIVLYSYVGQCCSAK